MGEFELKKVSESDMDSVDVVSELRDAIGAGPEDMVRVATPQFERTPNMPDPSAPPADWGSLAEYGEVALREMGCGAWDDPDERGTVLMLFPGEWYSSIPRGLSIEDINGNLETFEPGLTDDDIRFGCLAFGVRTKARP